MKYEIPKLPSEFEIVGFEIRRGFGWRVCYWAWRLFKLHIPSRYCGFVAKIK